MKILFNLEYHTTFGENLVVNILPENGSAKVSQHKMMSSDGSHWYCEVSKTMKPGTYIDYYYSVVRGENELRHEWTTIPHRLEMAAQKAVRYTVYDHWLDIPEDSFMYSSAFTDCVMARKRQLSTPTEYQQTVRIKVRAPQLRLGERLAISGGLDVMGAWGLTKALPMT